MHYPYCELCNGTTPSHFALYMYVPMSVALEPWGVPSDIIRKHRTRVAWLHGLRLCACCVVTWFAPVCVSRGYMVCTCRVVTWFAPVCVSRGYMVCACRVVTWFVPVCVLRGYMVCACVRVAWLHGLPIALALALALALPRVAGSASSTL